MKRSFSIVRSLMLVSGVFLLSSMLLFASVKTASVSKIQSKSTKTEVSLCVSTSRYFSASDSKIAKPYVKISPKHYFNLELSYGDICLNSLKPDTEYTVTINKNIPLGSVALDKDYTLKSKTKNYKPSFSFPDTGYILPSHGEISIPIKTINVDKISISLYRINNNNLIRSINEYGLLRSMSNYKLEDISNTDGYVLWTKKMRLHTKKNEAKTTALPIGEFLKDRKPGVYIIGAKMLDKKGEEIYDYDENTQWFMISNIGLYSLRSADGLQIYTRRLSDAQIYDGVKLELISKNNEILDTTTAKNGVAFFKSRLLQGKKGLEAKAIYAYGKDGDFSVLDLSAPAHDLSDRGVGGRDNPGRYDAFIYSSRGIYRPGESVKFHALVRNQLGEAESGVNLSLKVYDSRHVKIYTKKLTTDALGHVSDTIEISPTSSTGRWSMELFAGSDKAIGKLGFLVEDFVPPKIKIELNSKIKELKPNQKTDISLTAKYLNGEPIPNAKIEVTTTLIESKKAFKGYESYHFGDIKETFYNTNLKTEEYITDINGKANIPFLIKEKSNSSKLITAHIELSVNELGGRPVRKVIDQFYDDKSAYIGIKPNFDQDAIDMEAYPSFDVAYIKNSKLSKGKLQYRLIKEKSTWNWRSNNGDWEYYRTYRDSGDISKGTISANGMNPSSLRLDKLDWGSYRLWISDGNNISTYRFSSGYEQSASKSSPDRLPIAIDKKSYKVGDTLRVNIKPKFTGPVLVSIANHNIIESRTVDMIAGKDTEVTFKVSNDWGSSAYVLASAFRAQSSTLGANRAIGVAPIEIKHPEQVIKLSLEHPKRVKSSSKVQIKIISAEAAGTTTDLTLAAVDEGILNLTDFKTPNPTKYFFGQQKLGIEIRDIYANLIRARGAHAKFDVGSDEMLKALSTGDKIASKRVVLSIFTDVVKFDADGVATVDLDIPADYQGSIKLMAVAWNKHAIGSVQADMVVKDSISSEYYMPRFISVGDSVKSIVTVNFDKTTDRGEYQIKLSTDGGVRLEKSKFDFIVDGIGDAKFSKVITMTGNSLLDGVIHLKISKDGKTLSKREWKIAVKSKYPQAYIRKMGLLDSGATFRADRVIDSAIWSNTHSVQLAISSKPLLPIESIKNELLDYTGRCAEQTTSRAMPWLYMKKTPQSNTLIQGAIDRLLTYQKLDGGFGLWISSKANIWVSSYVMDFLLRAKQLGYVVPSRNTTQGLNWLENNLDRWSKKAWIQEGNAYALYVLTHAGRTLMSELKFYATNKNSKISSAQAWGHLGASLAYVGENRLALKMFDNAKVATRYNSSHYSNYGGNIRDEAALVVLMQESKLGLDWESRFAQLAMHIKKRDYLSTQEMSLLLRASLLVGSSKSTKLTLSNGDKPLSVRDGLYTVGGSRIDDIPTITNDSNGKVWYTLGLRATPIPAYYSPKNNNGFSITKEIYTMDGKRVDTKEIKQNSRLVVLLKGIIQNNYIQNPLITDWIPAGFELDNPDINGVDATSGLKWIGKQTATEHKEYRDDRFVAALSQDADQNKSFQVAYTVRAVSRGTYTMPPAKVEDMYQPQYRAYSKFLIRKVNIKDAAHMQKSVVSKITLDENDYLAAYDGKLSALNRYTIVQLNILRNSIFAHAGLSFEYSNPMLHQRFLPYKWYSKFSTNSSQIYASLSKSQKHTIQKLLKEEKDRCGGELTLSDFYRVRNREFTQKDINKYSKASLRILLSSLFARHGLMFGKKDTDLDKIFRYMPWYKPKVIEAKYIYRNLMDGLEIANVKLISKSM